jgi:hypothetical protein
VGTENWSNPRRRRTLIVSTPLRRPWMAEGLCPTLEVNLELDWLGLQKEYILLWVSQLVSFWWQVTNCVNWSAQLSIKIHSRCCTLQRGRMCKQQCVQQARFCK